MLNFMNIRILAKNKSLNLFYREMHEDLEYKTKNYYFWWKFYIPLIWLSLFWWFVGIFSYIVSYIFLHLSLAWGRLENI
jgi:hypothetical protein